MSGKLEANNKKKEWNLDGSVFIINYYNLLLEF